MLFPALSIEARQILAELEQLGPSHDATEPEHARRFLNLERDTAKLVHFLLLSTRRKRILEIGTSNGYSTIWLAAAAALNGGSVTSIERDAQKQAAAHEHLQRAGLDESVTLIEGDASTAIMQLAGPFDCVFFDADRISAPEQLSLLLPKLQGDLLLLADNAISHSSEIAGYITAVEMMPSLTAFIAPVGKGLHVAMRR